MPERESPSKPAPVLRRLAWGLGLSATLLLLILAASLALMRTDTGQEWLRTGLSDLLSAPPDRRIELGRIDGNLPWNVHLESLTLADSEGSWLLLSGLHLRWSPWELLLGEVRIQELSAASVEMKRLPRARGHESSSKSEASLPEVTFAAPPLTVDLLSIPSVSISEALLGQPAVLEIMGFIQPSFESGGRSLVIQLNRVDKGPELKAHLAVEFQSASESMKMDLGVFESAGGIFSRIMALEDAGSLQLNIAGAGPASEWKGSLEGEAAHWGSIRSSITLSLQGSRSAELFTMIKPDGSSQAEGKRSALPEEIALHSKMRLLDSSIVQLDRLDAWSPGLSLAASGRFDLPSDAIAAGLSLKVSDPDGAAPAVYGPLQGKGELCASVSGTVQTPQADLSLDYQDIQWAEIGAEALFAQLRLDPPEPGPDLGAAGWRITGTGMAGGLRDLSGRALPEESLTWTLDTEIAPGGEDVSIRALRVQGTRHRIDILGKLNPSSLDCTMEAELQIDDLRTMTALLGRETPGTLKLAAHAGGNGTTRSASGKLRGNLTVPMKTSRALDGLLVSETSLALDFELREGEILDLSNGFIKSPAFEVKAGGSFHLPERSLKGEVLASMPDLKALAPLVHEDLSGRGETLLSVEGTLDDLSVNCRLNGQQVRWRQQPPSEIRSSVEAIHVPWKAQGKWMLALDQGKEKLEASTSFERDETLLRMIGWRLDGPGTTLKGDLTVDLDAATAEGAVQGRFEDLGRLGRFIGEPLAGGAVLDVKLQSPQNSQNAAFKVTGRNLSARPGKLSSLEVTADLKDLKGAIQGTLRSEISGLETGRTVIRSASLKADGDRSRLAFSGRASGKVLQETELQLAGSLARPNHQLNLKLTDFRGKFGPFPFALKGPALLEQSPEATSLDRLSLSLGQGNLVAGGRLTSGRASAQFRFEDIPLQVLALVGGPEMFGTATGGLQIEGPPSQPGATAELRLAEFRLRATEGHKLPPALLNAQARLQDGQVRGEISMERILEKPVRAELTIPLRLSLDYGLSVDLPREAPLQARVEMEGELERVAGFLPLADQTFSGFARASLDVRGSLSEPIFGGDIQLSRGFYENLNSGTVLKDLSAQIQARDQRLEITRFQATDGERGQISLSGSVSMDAASHFPVELVAALKEATLVRRKDLDATATGEVKISGSAQSVRVGGAITVAPAEYRIPARLPAGAADLEVIEIHRSGRRTMPERAEESTSKALPIPIDLSLTFPNRTYLRGRGLDSEWQGQLKIGGDAAQPTLTGRLNVVRGNFDFLDRRFELRQGTITFFGATPPVPLLDFIAEATTRDITALVRVTGPASSPEILIQSEPPLPQEEVLSRLLFGRSIDKISPVQALKLAQTLRSLSGGSGLAGLDFLGATRRLLGLDELEIRSTGGGSETGLGLGKYLTEEVYVDLEKDLSGSGGKISVEVELTPNISVESQVGSDAQTGIGINWKYDY
jgi:translocation and assembly module TamB